MALMAGDNTGTILEKKRTFSSKHQFGGATIMPSRCFFSEKVGSLAFISTIMNSESYKIVFRDHLLPNVVYLAGEKLIFQQDNIPIHESRLKKIWFKSKNFDILDCASKILNFNPVEHVLGDLAGRVYSHGRQNSLN